MPLMTKKNRFKFNVNLTVEELSSVPFVTGALFVKVRLVNGGSFKSNTSRVDVADHLVRWSHVFHFECTMVASVTSGVLEPCTCRISVRKELKGGKSYQKLGYADIDLAQFAGAGCTERRYLLDGYSTKRRQDNSTLKLVIEMSLISGDPCFKVPAQPKSDVSHVDGKGEDGALHSGNKGAFSDSSDSSNGTSLVGPVDLNPDPCCVTADPVVSDFKKESSHSLDMGASSISSGQAHMLASSTHMRNSSADSAFINSRISGVTGDQRQFASIPRAGKNKLELHIPAGDRRLNTTRVDPNTVADELMSGFNFRDDAAGEGSGGLQLYVAKDGTALVRTLARTSQVDSSASQQATSATILPTTPDQ